MPDAIKPLGGIHHVTALASDPARNVEFYTKVLGLRLVKRTVNFDDPNSWHLYYGDGAGSPGTILTFFPIPDLTPGRQGVGQAVETAFLVRPASLSFWIDRLVTRGIAFEGPSERFGQKVVRFRDPDNLRLEIVADANGADASGWDGMPVPPEHALSGLHSVTLWEQDREQTAQILTEDLGFRAGGQEENRFRFVSRRGDGTPGHVVDILSSPDFWRGGPGAGTVHHVAFRAADDDEQQRMHARFVAAGRNVTEVRDRKYFRSIYFREPGGVLFEVATDAPGFAVDEPQESLGRTLQLPLWLELRRQQIADNLPALDGEAR